MKAICPDCHVILKTLTKFGGKNKRRHLICLTETAECNGKKFILRGKQLQGMHYSPIVYQNENLVQQYTAFLVAEYKVSTQTNIQDQDANTI